MIFTIFGVGLLSLFHTSTSKIKGESVLPLFRRPFWINVGVPCHQGGDKGIRHLPTGQGDVFKPTITQVSLTDVDTVAVLGKRTIDRRGAATGGGSIVSESHVGGTRILTGFQPDTKEPVVRQNAAQPNAQTIAFAFALLPVVGRGDATLHLPTPVLVAQSRVAIEFQLRDWRRQFPFSRRSRCPLFCQLGTNFFRFLIVNDLFADKQIEQCSCILCLGRDAAENERSGHQNIYESFQHWFSLG